MYVLLRDADNRKIAGIVTATDLSIQFKKLAEPFLLIREIELHIREILLPHLKLTDYEFLGTPDDPKKVESTNELTFGAYVRLLQQPEVWERLGMNVDKAGLTDLCDDIRKVRNKVMHFSRDYGASDLQLLNSGVSYMQQLYQLLPD